MSETAKYLTYHYCDVTVKPYKGVSGSQGGLLMSIFSKLQDDAINDKHYVINRTANRPKVPKRNLVILGIRLDPKTRRVFARIAKIKNHAPSFLTKKFEINDIDNPDNHEFVDFTNFVLDLSRDIPVAMVQFNNDGPRIPDLKFMILHLAKEYQIAFSCNTVIHVKGKIEDILENLQNVFEIELKVRPTKQLLYNEMNQGFASGMAALSQSVPSNVRLQLSYDRVDDGNGGYKKNIPALDFGRNILEFLKSAGKYQQSALEDLKMKIDQGDGIEEFDILNYKICTTIKLEKQAGGFINKKEIIERSGLAFNEYLKTLP